LDNYLTWYRAGCGALAEHLPDRKFDARFQQGGAWPRLAANALCVEVRPKNFAAPAGLPARRSTLTGRASREVNQTAGI
jgi:hypothetical protein